MLVSFISIHVLPCAHTSIVANLYLRAIGASAVTPDTKIMAIKGGQRYSLDYRGGECREQQEHEGSEEEDGQGGCRAQHCDSGLE